ncbi:hypothetical protein MJT46_003339 [Ovis ammon polii x Ovis aries]|nr:hypothetical protein MJT46_003339 [Ovis ammon polii x Ovis aries]
MALRATWLRCHIAAAAKFASQSVDSSKVALPSAATWLAPSARLHSTPPTWAWLPPLLLVPAHYRLSSINGRAWSSSLGQDVEAASEVLTPAFSPPLLGLCCPSCPHPAFVDLSVLPHSPSLLCIAPRCSVLLGTDVLGCSLPKKVPGEHIKNNNRVTENQRDGF